MNKHIKLKTGLDRNFHLKNEGSDFIYLYVEIQGEKVEQQKRLPLNLGLVIDRSGSMSGDKISYARKALKFVIQNLGSDDSVALVQYDNEVDVLLESQQLANKDKYLQKVEMISPRASTNLSGGMMEGFNQVSKSFQKEGMVNRVFLLSDGLANQGVRDPEKIVKLASNFYQKSGISLSTFGIGADFNEQLMMNLAEQAAGTQYFIGLPEDIPNIFAEELKELLAVLGQNAALQLSFPTDYLSLEKAFGFKAKESDGTIEARLGDVFSEDRKAALFKFKLKKAIDQELEFSAKLSFDDVITEMSRISLKKSLSLKPTEDAGQVENSGNKMVLEQIAVFESNTKHKELIKMLREGSFEACKQAAQSLISYIESQLLHFPHSEELKAQLETTKELYEEIDEFAKQDHYAQSMSMKHYSSSSAYLLSKNMTQYQSRGEMRKKEKGSDNKA